MTKIKIVYSSLQQTDYSMSDMSINPLLHNMYYLLADKVLPI
ncbi:hypothetical protein [Shewanella algidipiscicola]|nr:hypothetical protein [Shewanella algidipiscicola]